jgi:AhpD family alkylhydroperoxidase
MGTVSDRATVFKEVEELFGRVPEWVKTLPSTLLPGFWSTWKDFYFAETKIPNKYKELIGLAVSGATRCKYCQLFHTEGAKLHGATDEEIAEACAMAGVTMMASTYINALGVDFDQFRSETLEIVKYVKANLRKKGVTLGKPVETRV